MLLSECNVCMLSMIKNDINQYKSYLVDSYRLEPSEITPDILERIDKLMSDPRKAVISLGDFGWG